VHLSTQSFSLADIGRLDAALRSADLNVAVMMDFSDPPKHG
jgi:hypothetical protein